MNGSKLILDLCGGTGSWSKPYVEAGYKVVVIDTQDVLQTEAELVVGDVRDMEVSDFGQPYGILAAPPCTMFSHARTKANAPRDVEGAMSIVSACLRIIWEAQYSVETGDKTTPLQFWALENPNHGILKYLLGKPAYTFTPADFGHDYKKQTALWGWFNDPVKNPKEIKAPKFDYMKTKNIHGEYYGKLPRKVRRAITPQNFANAFYQANK